MVGNERNDEINIAKVLPWVILVFMIVFMFYLWPDTGDLKKATNASSESTETVTAETVSGDEEVGKRAEILDLINFRSEPSEAMSAKIGTVNKGESFKIIEEQENWLKIEKEDGVTGYITTDPKYVSIVSE